MVKHSHTGYTHSILRGLSNHEWQTSNILPKEAQLNPQDPDNLIIQAALEGPGSSLILTASHRQSNYYSQLLSQHLANSNSVWTAPQVYSLDDWISNSSDMVLDDLGEKLLWQKSFERLADHRRWSMPANMDSNALCQAAIQAASLCDHWNIDSNRAEFKDNDNSLLFCYWHRSFQHSYRQINCRSRSQQLLHLIQQPPTQLAQRIIVTGFIEFTPAQQALIESFKRLGTTVQIHQPAQKQQQINCHSFQEASDELHWLAKHSHDWYQQTGAEQGTTNMTIIVPDLESRWHELFATFNHVFDRHDNSRDSFAKPSRAFNLSGGIALIDMPLIDCAYQLIQLNPESTFSEILPLLHHPALQLGVNTTQRKEIEKLLSRGYRKNLEQTYQQFPDWHWLQPFASHSYWSTDDYPSRQLLKICQRLEAAHWLEALKLTSAEYQQHQQWLKKIQQVSRLDRLEQTLSMRQTLKLLSSALHSLFQPEVNQARIQILGLYEAIGLQCDRLWLSGFTDQVLPKAPAPSIFIPTLLQHRQGIAESHPHTSLLYSTQLWQHLIATAPEIITSYSRIDGDRENTASSFIRQHTETAITVSYPNEQHTANYNNSEQIHVDIDNTSYPSSLLEDQSACPLRAAFRHAVKIKNTNTSDYYNQLDAGILMHTALDQLLKGGAKPDIREQTLHFIRQQLQEKSRLHPWLGNSQAGRQIQKQVADQISSWLERESKGRNNSAVIATEKEYRCTIGPLNCTFRIDRIDAVDHLSEQERTGILLIDYKTGSNTNSNNWQGQRPSSPQLLAYAIAVGTDNVSGISYIALKPDNAGYIVHGNQQVGETFTDSSLIVNKHWLSSSQWQLWLEQQTQAVTELAHEFANGKVTLTPKDSSVCKHCDYKPACRINQAQEAHSDE